MNLRYQRRKKNVNMLAWNSGFHVWCICRIYKNKIRTIEFKNKVSYLFIKLSEMNYYYYFRCSFKSLPMWLLLKKKNRNLVFCRKNILMFLLLAKNSKDFSGNFSKDIYIAKTWQMLKPIVLADFYLLTL